MPMAMRKMWFPLRVPPVDSDRFSPFRGRLGADLFDTQDASHQDGRRSGGARSAGVEQFGQRAADPVRPAAHGATYQHADRARAAVLADVPEDGVLVSVAGPVRLGGLGILYAAPMAAADKISPITTSNASGHLLVEFYPDVNLDDARGMLLNAGAVLSDNPISGRVCVDDPDQ